MASTATLEFNPAPMETEEAIDPRWLSHALSIGRSAPVRVKSVELLDSIGWNCLTLMVKVSYDGDQPADLPDRFAIKGLFGIKHSEYTQNGALIAESGYYREIKDDFGLYSPRCYYSGVDNETGAGVVVLEDMTLRNVRFFSGLDAFTSDQVHQSLEQYAILHGRSWDAPPSRHPWITRKLARFVETGRVAPDKLTEAMHGSRGDKLPEYLRSGKILYDGLTRLHERSSSLNANYIHGDCHPGNIFEIDGKVGLFDWQILQRNHWSLDIAYHLGSVLTVEDRRRDERDLIRFYLDRVAAHGGTPPAFETAFVQYREAVPYGFFLWAVTMRVDQPIIDANVTRLGTSAADHESYKLLGL